MPSGSAVLLTGSSGQAKTQAEPGLTQECCAIFLTESVKSTAQWILKVSCNLDQGDASMHVATVITTPLRRELAQDLSDSRPATRAVARFNMPGATSWQVDGRLLKVYANEEETPPKVSKSTVYIDASRGNGGQAIELIEGIVVPKQNYRFVSALGAGSVVVPQGAVIQQVSFSSTAAGVAHCVFTTPGLGDAHIAASQSLSFAPAQCLDWLAPVTIEFQNEVASWFVAWVV